MKRKLPSPPPRAAYAASQPLYSAIEHSLHILPGALDELTTARNLTQQNHLQLSPEAARQCAVEIFHASIKITRTFDHVMEELSKVLVGMTPPITSEQDDMDEEDREMLQVLEDLKRMENGLPFQVQQMGEAHVRYQNGLGLWFIKYANLMGRQYRVTENAKRRKTDLGDPSIDPGTRQAQQEAGKQSEEEDTPIIGINHNGRGNEGTGVEYQDVTAEVDKKLHEKLQQEQSKKLNRKERKRKRESILSATSVTEGVTEGTEKLHLNDKAGDTVAGDPDETRKATRRARKRARRERKSQGEANGNADIHTNGNASASKTNGTHDTHIERAEQSRTATSEGTKGKRKKRSGGGRPSIGDDAGDSARSSKKRKTKDS
ncbi:Hypothetical protein D9617_14g076430 [Elsinoe fawcettii]|nr:Hypothetical protein D9617_14g076430 [Elsinoe fawcettii]